MSAPLSLLKKASIGRGLRGDSSILISNVDLELQTGDCTRLTGSNGVGKTSLIETALGIIPPLEGSRTLPWKFGSSCFQRAVGYLPSTVDGYPNLTLLDWMRIVSRGCRSCKTNQATAFKRVEELWEELGGRGQSGTMIGNLSSGNRKKALFLPVVAQQRKLIVLDEPFEEVDLYGQQAMATLVNRQIVSGAAVLIVSHRDMSHLIPVDRELKILDGVLESAGNPPLEPER